MLNSNAVEAYSIHAHASNDRIARGVKANGLFVRLEGHHEFAPQRIQTSTPWLDPLKGSVVLQPGGRVGSICACNDVGTLCRVAVRSANRKLLACLAAIEVVHATTGETAFFVVRAASRKSVLEENSSVSRELTLNLDREKVTSPLY
eukprot:scaffold23413_cov29-Prasinocladus_malaysianus.AAC.1